MDHAQDFQDRHAPRLKAQGLLTDANADSFAMLCRTFAELQAVKTGSDRIGVMKYVALSKLFSKQAEPFHIGPSVKTRPALETRVEDGKWEF
jgi:hypothetical protein